MLTNRTSYRHQTVRWLKAVLFAVAVTLVGWGLYWKMGGSGKNEVVLFVLAILAIGFALYQFTDSDELKETLKSVTQDLQETAGIVKTELLENVRFVAANTSTRYVGTFPSNMEDVQTVISNTARQLRIMVDVAGYGSYSRAHEFLRYATALKELKHRTPRVSVELLLFDRTFRANMLKDQFPQGEWESTIKGSKLFNEFFENRGSAPETYDEFIQRLESNHDGCEKEFCEGGVKIKRKSGDFPFFLWLQDDKEVSVRLWPSGQTCNCKSSSRCGHRG
jgi:hypothetical protein